MKNYPSLAIQIPRVLLPKPGTDLTQWAVIACDQFTSEPDYWQQVETLVGDAPSTYHMILPEVMLGTPAEQARINSTQAAMRAYLESGLLVARDEMIYVEREVDGKLRRGLVLALDLEAYDFNKGSQTLIRATEGTIIDRLPPRIRIREGAPLELPHILVLIDDPDRSVIEPLADLKSSMPLRYDFDLMLGSGHLRGYAISDAHIEAGIVGALQKLVDPAAFRTRYGLSADEQVLLFAMGDGNHSLATAKAIWEKMKANGAPMDHPARYALVEIENVHDEGLAFEPIHRVLFGVKHDLPAAARAYFGERLVVLPVSGAEEMVMRVADTRDPARQRLGMITAQGASVWEITGATSNLVVGSLQAFLDGSMASGGADKIDYVHGLDALCRLGAQSGHAGFYLPAMPKSDLFKTVIVDGALPRKTFSMGEAHEKRFYMECRAITAD